MPVIRTIHNRENPYVVLNKKALWNEKLSLKAIGLWAKCISRPDNWEFSVKELANSGIEGKRSIYSAIDELIEEGYALKLEHYEKEDDGKFCGGGVGYIFFEFPPTPQEKEQYLEEFKKSFRRSGFGDCRDGDCRNAPLISNEVKQVKKEQQQEENPVVAFFDDPDGILKDLRNGKVDERLIPKALETWQKYKQHIKEKAPDNPLGFLIWMIKKDVNPFKAKEAKASRIAKRKEWAYQNETFTNSGGCSATPEGFEVISGSISTFYRYDEDSEFWRNKGL